MSEMKLEELDHRHRRKAPMRRCIVSLFAIAIAAVMPGALQGAAPENEKSADEAMKLAVKLTEEGAATFDTFNAKAMANYYVDDAVVVLVTRDGGGLKNDVHSGRADIEKFYADIFKKPETIKSKNAVEYAKLLAPDVLVIAGTFDTNTLKPDSPKLPFYQVRVKQGDKWLMSSLRIFFVPQK
jgi:ketosteroid isomerase-like protein